MAAEPLNTGTWHTTSVHIKAFTRGLLNTASVHIKWWIGVFATPQEPEPPRRPGSHGICPHLVSGTRNPSTLKDLQRLSRGLAPAFNTASVHISTNGHGIRPHLRISDPIPQGPAGADHHRRPLKHGIRPHLREEARNLSTFAGSWGLSYQPTPAKAPPCWGTSRHPFT